MNPPITPAQWGARVRIARALGEPWFNGWLDARGEEMPRLWDHLVDKVGPEVSARGYVFRARVDGVITIRIVARGETIACAMADGPGVSCHGQPISHIEASALLAWARRFAGVGAVAMPSAIEYLARSKGFGARTHSPDDPWHRLALVKQSEMRKAAQYEADKAAVLARVTKL